MLSVVSNIIKNVNSIGPLNIVNNIERNKIIKIPIEKIKPNPYQPRKYFEKMALEELSESIKQYGVLQPINVRKIGSDGYELVAGERRLRASKIAELKEIPAIVVEMNDNDSAIVALIENLQREDLSFMEEAEGYFNLISEHGITQEVLAQKIGKSQSTIANKLRLLKLSDPIKKIIVENGLSERHARALLKLPDEEWQFEILDEVCKKRLNVKDTEEVIKNMIEERVNRTDVSDEVDKIIYVSSQDKAQKTKHIKITLLKDIRIFSNTLNQAVDMLKNSGIEAETTKNESDEYIEYVVRVPKA